MPRLMRRPTAISLVGNAVRHTQQAPPQPALAAGLG